jgi:uncharacterized membrane protein YoaT (DUF817 family)
MKNEYFVKVVALVGIVLNIFFTYDHIYEYISSNELIQKEYLLSFAVLDLGWVVLLVWFLNNIYERKEIIIFYLIPLLGINMTHSIHNVLISQWSIPEAALNMVYGVVFSSIFILGYIKMNRGKKHGI